MTERRDRLTAWRAYMRAGAFEAAWRISDQVLVERRDKRCDHLPLHQRWLWDGQEIAGQSVLIRCYHGLGDTIQFIRYAPLVKKIAARVDIVIQPELESLVRTMAEIDCIWTDASAPQPCSEAIEVEIMELPHLFRTTLDSVPKTVPYFDVKPARLARTGEKLNVGLVWNAGTGWDHRRNIPDHALAPLAGMSGIRIHILQQHLRGGLPNGLGVLAQRDSIFELARIMRALDLVITVDSMPAHLAGALAVPVWVLLHADADWRWMKHRRDSPWYPTMRLFRQHRSGEWNSVIGQVVSKIRRVQRNGGGTDARGPACESKMTGTNGPGNDFSGSVPW